MQHVQNNNTSKRRILITEMICIHSKTTRRDVTVAIVTSQGGAGEWASILFILEILGKFVDSRHKQIVGNEPSIINAISTV